jgi:LPXTG-motif cell wall-anchored protein
MPRQRIEKNPLRAAAESGNTWFLLAGGLLAVIALIALRR